MKLRNRLIIILSMCFIFSRIVYLLVSPAAYYYISTKEKLTISNFLQGIPTHTTLDKKIPSQLRIRYLNEKITDTQKIALKKKHTELNNTTFTFFSILQIIFYNINIKFLFWWSLLAISSILTLKGHFITPYLVCTLPIIYPIIQPSNNLNPLEIAIYDIYDTKSYTDIDLMQRYVIGSQIGKFLNKDDPNFKKSFQLAWYKYLFFKLFHPFRLPNDHIQFEILSTYYCLLLMSIIALNIQYFEKH